MKALLVRSGGIAGVVGTLTMVGLMLAGPASATDPVTTAFDDMETKVTTYGAAIVALVVISAALFLGIKYLRKGVNKA